MGGGIKERSYREKVSHSTRRMIRDIEVRI
jgi:hypothetical protein